jgi:hypothetical protein
MAQSQPGQMPGWRWAKPLDEIRGLLNEDIISHGKTQGLETSVLVNMLNASVDKLQLSPQTRLYYPIRGRIANHSRWTARASRRRLLAFCYSNTTSTTALSIIRSSPSIKAKKCCWR